jgi:hypothetical protein
MEKNEFDALVKELNQQTSEALKRDLADAVKGLIKADELSASLESMGITKEKVSELVTAVEKQGDKINELIEKAATPSPLKTLGQQLNGMKDTLKSVYDAKSGKQIIKLDITDLQNRQAAQKATILNSSISSSNLGMREPGFNNDPFRLPIFRSIIPIFPVEPNSNGTIFYTEQDTVTRGAAARTEGNAAAASTLTFIGRYVSLTNITDSIKMSKESLLDIANLQREVQSFIELNLMLKEDEDLWDGTGVAPILKGLYTYGTAYVASGNTYGTANFYDLIADMKLQVETGYNGKYMATHVVMNNADAQKMWSTKDADGNYIVPWFVNPVNKTVHGLTVVESSIVDAGTILVCDIRHARLYQDSQIEIEIGYDSDDFSKRLVTMVGNIREYLLIKNIDTLAFVACSDTTAAIAALNTVA